MNNEARTRILETIEHNPKLSSKELAAILGMEESEIADEILKMEQEHIICGYLALINWSETETTGVTAMIEVKVNPQTGAGYDAIAEQIAAFDEVESVYLMSGTYDFMVVIEGKTMLEVSSFVFDKLSTLDSIQSTATHFCLKKYKLHSVHLTGKPEDNRRKISI